MTRFNVFTVDVNVFMRNIRIQYRIGEAGFLVCATTSDMVLPKQYVENANWLIRNKGYTPDDLELVPCSPTADVKS